MGRCIPTHSNSYSNSNLPSSNEEQFISQPVYMVNYLGIKTCKVHANQTVQRSAKVFVRGLVKFVPGS